jgi:hypothetical protein
MLLNGVSKWVPFLTLGRRFTAAPHFSGHISPRLPSRKSKHRIAVKSEVSNNERTDTYGGQEWPLCPEAACGSRVEQAIRDTNREVRINGDQARVEETIEGRAEAQPVCRIHAVSFVATPRDDMAGN